MREFAAVGGVPGFLGAALEVLPRQFDLPEGQVWRCSECGARLRTGQPHIAAVPVPHGTLQLLTRRGE